MLIKNSFQVNPKTASLAVFDFTPVLFSVFECGLCLFSGDEWSKVRFLKLLPTIQRQLLAEEEWSGKTSPSKAPGRNSFHRKYGRLFRVSRGRSPSPGLLRRPIRPVLRPKPPTV